ncbi:MAG: serine/threonine protein kinase [Myxococcales bacterium]|nr:serine/threonine protein kinase [Myxococcales bacterium]MCB9737198.1 serine/threonine protein kinase [Deltaproteobacteria bacterium]
MPRTRYRPPALDVETSRRSASRAALLAAPSFPLFLLLDAYVRAARYPDASLALCAAVRVAGFLALVGAGLLLRRPGWSAAGVRAVTALTLGLLSAGLGVISVDFGGLESAYATSIVFFGLTLAAFLAADWRRLVLLTTPTVVAYYAALVVGVALSPAHAGELADPRAVAGLVVNLVLVLGILSFGFAAGHLQHRLTHDLEAARRLGRYRPEVLLGRGGMSEVWLASDARLGRQVALKILRDSHPGEERHRRFEREAQATSRLESPHTVRIIDYGATGDGTSFIAMERLHGMDLARMIIDHGPLEPRRVVHLARHAADSLAEAHARGLVHRDVKPANLFVCDAPVEDHLKVVDFGVARLLADTDVHLTLAGVLVGTPVFMAPELLRGRPADPRSDVYALGATLYAALTARLPVEAATPHDLFEAHQREAIPPLGPRCDAALPEGLEPLVMRCLSFDPARRPADGAEVARALAAVPAAPWTAEEARAWWASAGAASPAGGAATEAVTDRAHPGLATTQAG